MTESQQTIMTLVQEYLEKNPGIRFCQALFNLGITEFADKTNPEAKGYLLRDPYGDTDERILKRIKENGN